MALGIGVYVASFMVGFSWLAFCFGSILVGILLLIFAPHILLAPFSFGVVLGNAMLLKGKNESEKKTNINSDELGGL